MKSLALTVRMFVAWVLWTPVVALVGFVALSAGEIGGSVHTADTTNGPGAIGVLALIASPVVAALLVRARFRVHAALVAARTATRAARERLLGRVQRAWLLKYRPAISVLELSLGQARTSLEPEGQRRTQLYEAIEAIASGDGAAQIAAIDTLAAMSERDVEWDMFRLHWMTRGYCRLDDPAKSEAFASKLMHHHRHRAEARAYAQWLRAVLRCPVDASDHLEDLQRASALARAAELDTIATAVETRAAALASNESG